MARDEQATQAAYVRLARPLRSAEDLDPLLERVGDARVVMLGEASHGTHEYYTWRTLITQRLVEEKGFHFLAVEGDWPDCRRVDRYLKSASTESSGRDVLHAFDRWPTWMWANREIVDLVEWMRGFNEGHPERRGVGFYGLDVYSLWDSLREVLAFLEARDGDAVEAAREAFRCFEPYAEDPQDYARATWIVPSSCRDEVVRLLARVERFRAEVDGSEAAFDAEQNALVARNAEDYYRTMVRGSAESWNVRDEHMMDTLDRLLDFHGPGSKAVVWAHNTHIGDARATDMAGEGMVNIGQLARERLGPDAVVLVGFGSYQGSVVAARQWGLPMRRLHVPEAREGSVEALLHGLGSEDRLLLFTRRDRGRTLPLSAVLEDAHAEALLKPRAHRAIGVVYDPRAERYGNYVPTILPQRYDAFLYFDQTRALHPLHLVEEEPEMPETFPWGY